MCKGKAIKFDDIEDDVEAEVDKNLLERQSAIVEKNKLTFGDDVEDVDDFLDDLLGFDDDDEDDDDDEEDEDVNPQGGD